MLYDEDEQKQDIILVEELNKSKLRKRNIVCGIIILCCFCVIFVSAFASYKMKNNDKNKVANSENSDIVTLSQNNESEQYTGKHMQITKHDLEQIKSKFVPQQNPNAQEDIKNIYYSDEKVAYLTFDDGPSRTITPRVLDILKQEQVPATFFVLGSRVDLNPDLVQREYDEGHYIANHGYSHEYSQIYASRDTVFEEYVKCENAIKNALNNQDYNSYLFRFPGGSSGGRYADVKAEAKGLLNSYGVTYTNWNCLTGDAEGKTTPEELMAYLQETMQGDGSIIVLMHDASDKTYTADTLPTVISYLREQGYTFKNFYEVF